MALTAFFCIGKVVNPKRPGLFGLPDNRRGVESTHFGKRTLPPPHFHSRPTNSISYESWHMLLKFGIGCWGWNCSLGRSPKWPRSRWTFNQKSWNWQFLSYKNIIHLKRKLTTIVIDIWNKITDFCFEKNEKKSIPHFSISKNCNFSAVSAKFMKNLSR